MNVRKFAMMPTAVLVTFLVAGCAGITVRQRSAESTTSEAKSSENVAARQSVIPHSSGLQARQKALNAGNIRQSAQEKTVQEGRKSKAEASAGEKAAPAENEHATPPEEASRSQKQTSEKPAETSAQTPARPAKKPETKPSNVKPVGPPLNTASLYPIRDNQTVHLLDRRYVGKLFIESHNVTLIGVPGSTIDGDVYVLSNGFTLAGVTVDGKVIIVGNDANLTGNRITGGVESRGKGNRW